MNNEIKEILDDFKWYIEQKNEQDINGEYEYPRELTQEEAKILLDYITNLQQENKELNDDNIWWTNRFKAVERDNREYKSRMDKAIKYIKNKWKEDKYYHSIENCLEFCEFNKDDLINILQGSDKE